ncbi:MAG: hypothetical protein ABSB25_02830 [Sedimentisphaerales bacterium]|jgi:hypothetical protein
MVHNTKKKALYEVIGRAGSKSGYEQLHPNGTAGKNPSTNPETLPNVVRWVRKPGFVQFDAGRIEFSIPYQVGIAIALGMLLAAVVLFRVGQRVGNRDIPANTPAAKPVVTPSTSSGQTKPVAPKPVTQDTSAATVVANQPTSTGKNRIVLKMYQVRSHLEPAKEYFDKMGVATEIIEKDNWYYLVTKNKYDNPGKAGTDGYLAKQKIIELGAGYKAPVGFETFGPNPFSDAYGKRFDD